MFEHMRLVDLSGIPVSMIATGGRMDVCVCAGTSVRRGHAKNDMEPVGQPAGGLTVPRRAAAEKSETAVRDYLRHLAGLRPSGTVGARSSRTGPGHEDALEADFVLHARQWAARTGVDARVLAEFGVKSDVLVRAGLVIRSASESARRQYGRQPFTVAQLAIRAGVSQATAQRVINADAALGEVERVGQVPGRHSKLFRKVSGSA